MCGCGVVAAVTLILLVCCTVYVKFAIKHIYKSIEIMLNCKLSKHQIMDLNICNYVIMFFMQLKILIKLRFI